MLDQSFSAENFRKIFDIENRKGVYLEGDFYKDIVDINKRIKEVHAEIKVLKGKKLSKEKYVEEREKLEEKKMELKEKKEGSLIEKLNDISARVTSRNFKLTIVVDKTISSKPVYKTTYNLENILTLKQLQYNFRKLYKVKQSNRYSIISQLKNILSDDFPKIILRTDIKEFYESIPHENLYKKINNESLLTPLSIKFIRQILDEFERLSGCGKKGIPRGIGISPYLAELYMRDVDSKIKNLPNVMYYARYVDDIIVIFMPSSGRKIIDYKKNIEDVFKEEELLMNEDKEKTKVIDLSNQSKRQNYFMEYLGYKFIANYNTNGRIEHFKLTISGRKKKRYAERLLKAFTLYSLCSKRNEKQARKIFVKRIKFLMSNARLVNNKRNVITGIYYTNSLVNTDDDFQILDRYFSVLVNRFKLPSHLEKRITSQNSFVQGFNPAYISKFSAVELSKIMKNWTK